MKRWFGTVRSNHPYGLKPILYLATDVTEEDLKIYNCLYKTKKEAIKSIKKRMQSYIDSEEPAIKEMRKLMKELK